MYNTMNNPSAHPSYSHYYLLSPSTLFLFSFFVHLIVFFCTSCCFFAHLIVFCTSYCFLHILLFCTFLFHCTFYSYFSFLTICMPLCYVTYIICILIVLHCHWADLIRLHFTSSYALYNYYVTNKETLDLGPYSIASEIPSNVRFFSEIWMNEILCFIIIILHIYFRDHNIARWCCCVPLQ